MATTLLLDRSSWDCCIDAGGNIALASEPYSQSQDVASECRVVQGECYYDTGRGVPYFGQVLGQQQPVQVLKERLVTAALLVPGVAGAVVFLTQAGRTLSGQVQFETGAGTGISTL